MIKQELIWQGMKIHEFDGMCKPGHLEIAWQHLERQGRERTGTLQASIAAHLHSHHLRQTLSGNLAITWIGMSYSTGFPLMNILTWNMTSLMPKSHLSRVEECQGTHGQSLWDIALVRVAKQVWNSRLSNLYNYSVHHHMILFGSLGVFHGYPLPMPEKLTNHYH